jgi:hypothetical protein
MFACKLQVYQIIEYLGRNHNIVSEGLFRKHGNLKKQQALKERLNKVGLLWQKKISKKTTSSVTSLRSSAVSETFVSSLTNSVLFTR